MIVYKFIRENGGWENWDMILIDTLNLKNKLHAILAEWNYTKQFGREHNLKQLGGYNYEKIRNTIGNEENIKESVSTNLNNEYRKEKVTCEKCYSTVSRGELAKHQKTYKCIELFINSR